MRILYITNGISGSGGLERVLSVKASLLAEKFNYRIHIISLNESEKETFFDFSKKITFHSISTSKSFLSYLPSYLRGIQKLVNNISPDVISVCDDGLKGFLLPLFIKTKAKWIHESHASMVLGDRGAGIPFSKILQHNIKQYFGKNFTKIVLLTESNLAEWKLNNLAVIPNPLPFRAKDVSSLREKRLIAVGSYSYNKGYDLLLKVWNDIIRLNPDWELHIYGRGVQENVKVLADQLTLNNIFLYSPENNIEERYLESSIFVLPSRSEGFGMVIIEAMSCGLPVVSFDCPNGPKDIISDGKDGFLVQNGNVDAFAEKVQILIRDFELRKKLGSEGKHTSERYQAEIIVRTWDKLFHTLTERK